MKANHVVDNLEFSFTDADVTNLDNFVPEGDYNPHNVRPWLLHDHGFTLCVVFADSLQDAIDEAVDENKIERYLLTDKELADSMYHDDDCASLVRVPGSGDIAAAACRCATPGVSYLGNAGEPHDIESLGYVELPNPPRSFAAEFNAYRFDRFGKS